MTAPSASYRHGDVVIALFPNSSQLDVRRRPALVVQADHLDTGLPQLVLAMITSRMFRSNHPSRIEIMLDSVAGTGSGLLSDSVVMTDNLATVLESAIIQSIRSLPMSGVDESLRHTLDI